jgi:hypothetical protein
MSTRASAWLAWSLAGLSLAMIACGFVLAVLNRTDTEELVGLGALVSGVAVGGLVASRRPANPVGWFFLTSAACFALHSLAIEYATYGLVTQPG